MIRSHRPAIRFAGVSSALIAVVVAVGVASAPAASAGQHSRTKTTSGLSTSRMLFDSNRNGVNYEIYSMSTTGTGVTSLTSNQQYDSWWPRLSPDRKRIVFYRTPRGTYDHDYTKTSLWAMNYDGSGLTQLLAVGAHGWAEHGHAEWSPDGSHLVMFAGQLINPQLYVTDDLGRNPRQLTSRPGLNIDPSWSPSGTTVTFTGCPTASCNAAAMEVYTIPAAGGTATRVTSDTMRDNDPYFSPDGSRIAWLTQTSTTGGAVGAWNIRVAQADGSRLGYITNDANVNSRPQWSHDGTLIYFHRLVYSDPPPRFDIYVIHADGTSLTSLTAGQPGSAAYPSL